MSPSEYFDVMGAMAITYSDGLGRTKSLQTSTKPAFEIFAYSIDPVAAGAPLEVIVPLNVAGIGGK